MTRRRADLLFTRVKVAVFVDGCFWHACPEHRTYPKVNSAWWRAKLARNVERDRTTNEHLERLGWVVVRVWEHEAPDEAADHIAHVVTQRSPGEGHARSLSPTFREVRTRGSCG